MSAAYAGVAGVASTVASAATSTAAVASSVASTVASTVGATSTPAAGTPTSATQMLAAQRAPIYIHSKCMVVDDVYMIMGSANINERSLSGRRDTEIAFGAYQPAFVETHSEGRRGGVQAFRMQLWAAHLGIKDSSELEFCRNPGTLDVAREVGKRAHKHWDQYTQVAIVDMSGHLMPYPYTVERNGGEVSVVGTDSGCALQASSSKEHCFPDTAASITGCASYYTYGTSAVTM